jgi:hypothetical protein
MKYRPTKSRKWAEQRRNRRIIQEYGLTEAKRVGALDSPKEQKKKQKQIKKKTKIRNKQKRQNKTGQSIGSDYETKYNEFLKNGGDPNSCPFD